jgi:hypothetical protein
VACLRDAGLDIAEEVKSKVISQKCRRRSTHGRLTICSATARTGTSGSSKPPSSIVDRRIVDILWRSRAASAANETRDHEMNSVGTFVRSTRSGD